MASKKKLATSVAAVATAAALLLGGTFAWQSGNQTALNEGTDTVNPGGRLHNDMWYVSATENNNDIYVENFAEEDIFARVRLSEYMEIVLNQGTPGEKVVTVAGSKADLNGNEANDVATEKDLYKHTYVTHYFHDVDGDPATPSNATEEYWDWTMGEGESGVYYMPTFNKNKDSVAPDLNGLYRDRVGGISDRSWEQYSELDGVTALPEIYTGYTADSVPETKRAIYDIDSNMTDELAALDAVALADIIVNGDTSTYYIDIDNADKAVKLQEETHEVKPVGETKGLVSLTEWLDMVNTAGVYDEAVHGGYWVYDDTDDSGWVYWSSPIKGGETTGLLLDGIELNRVMDDTWYYAIEAVGQFVTADDLGSAETGDGFYAPDNNGEVSAPTEDALTLLGNIGVEVPEENVGGEEVSAFTIKRVYGGVNYGKHLYISPNNTVYFGIESDTYGMEAVSWKLTPDVGASFNYELDAALDGWTGDMDLLHRCESSEACSCTGEATLSAWVTEDPTLTSVYAKKIIFGENAIPDVYIERYSVEVASVTSDTYAEKGFLSRGDSVEFKMVAHMSDGTTKEITEGVNYWCDGYYTPSETTTIVGNTLTIGSQEGLNNLYVVGDVGDEIDVEPASFYVGSDTMQLQVNLRTTGTIYSHPAYGYGIEANLVDTIETDEGETERRIEIQNVTYTAEAPSGVSSECEDEAFSPTEEGKHILTGSTTMFGGMSDDCEIDVTLGVGSLHISASANEEALEIFPVPYSSETVMATHLANTPITISLGEGETAIFAIWGGIEIETDAEMLYTERNNGGITAPTNKLTFTFTQNVRSVHTKHITDENGVTKVYVSLPVRIINAAEVENVPSGPFENYRYLDFLVRETS